MLSLIRISNYAIIDDLEIELIAGFSVMTGETGAGKSILVDAVGLALGDRADAATVRAGTKRAEISLVFEIGDAHPAARWLVERGLEDEELCCLRRTISAEGRSRAFINNQPVTLKDLRSIGALLVDIHGQHEHQSLLTAAGQRQLLDAHGGHADLVRDITKAYADWRNTKHALAERSDHSADREAQRDMLNFQLGELESLGLAENEPEALRLERTRLKNFDQLHQSLAMAAEALYLSESASAHALAAKASQALEMAAAHDPELCPWLERINSAEIELKEAGSELAHRLDRLEADPARLDEIEARLDRIRQFARRHRVSDDEVPGLLARLRSEIAALDTGSHALSTLQTACTEARQRFDRLTGALSKARQDAGQSLEETVTARLQELGLPDARFLVHIEPKPEGRGDSTGIDQIEFRIASNPGALPGPLHRVASGGELSRIGLALSVAAIDAASAATLVFDEVDAGIGGAVAEVVGRRLRQLAAHHQVLCVTHLPQVASQGEKHYRIVKLTDGRSSRTQVRMLDAEQRIEELSRMLGGVDITAATRAHAEEMIRQAAGG